jgi:hypothetical protein
MPGGTNVTDGGISFLIPTLRLFPAGKCYTCPMKAGLLVLIFACFVAKADASEPFQVKTAPKDLPAVVEDIKNARVSIFVHANAFIASPVAKALVNAHKRGVDVQVIFGRARRNEEFSANYLSRSGIPTYFDLQHEGPKDSTLIIDNAALVCGWLRTGNSIDEGKLQSESNGGGERESMERHRRGWAEHKGHAERYTWQASPDSSKVVGSEIPSYFRMGSAWRTNTRLTGK